MLRNWSVNACSLLLTVGLALAVMRSGSSAQGLPIVQFSTSAIGSGGCSESDATTAIDVSMDPNGFVLGAFKLEFSVVPSEINLVSVVGASGSITASGEAGGSNFSLAATFPTNQTDPFPVGTITVQGCVSGGQMILAKQTYTDGDTFEDTNVTAAVIAATTVESDGDGVPDAIDNCPYTPNADQQDTGGIGSGSAPDGIGDVCQCGDVNGNGEVTLADSVIILRSMLEPPTATQQNPQLCDVGGSAGCTLADSVVIFRATLTPPTATILQQCGPAMNQP